jgi:AcrR family transcriptional regulator
MRPATATDSAVPGGRERKKARTRRELATAARRLTFENGLDAVSIQQIAAVADVSPRTFFNYFRCKDEAVVGVDPALVADLAQAVRERPADESPLVALTRALLETSTDPEITEGWVQRTELVRRHPTLLPRHLAAMADVEEALTVSTAVRLGTSAECDPFPGAIVASVVAVLRSTVAWWMRTDRLLPLDRVLAESFAALAAGFSTPRPANTYQEPSNQEHHP